VTEALAEVIDSEDLSIVFAAGPVPMMRAVAEVTRPKGIPTIASLNPIMVDGTGMCGGCRVDVGGETKFACVDGPEFDAHLVDFDLLARRNRAYLDFEVRQNTAFDECQAVKQ
jgi:ferredoxin--NADP+ reductase